MSLSTLLKRKKFHNNFPRILLKIHAPSPYLSNMTYRHRAAHILMLTFLMVGLALAEEPRPEKPNIVLILIDDLGWQDVGIYDIDEKELVETPHIDALAREGVLFWQGYSPSPTCTPSRAAIVSGMHPARSQCTHISGGVLPKIDRSNRGLLITPWFSGRMTVDQPSIAEALRRGGYTTGHTGKWHNSSNRYGYPRPTDVGFQFSSHDVDYMKGKYGSSPRGIQTAIADRDQKYQKRPLEYSTADSPFPLDENGFPVDPVQLETISFMEENKSEPFFLFNATWLVHAPIQSRSEALVKKYYEKYLAGLEKKNQKRVKEGRKALPPVPLDRVVWNERGWNPFYHAMVETLDDQIGQTVRYLKETDDPRWKGHKLIENTYLIFTSDNGGVISARAEQITSNAPLTKGKKYTREGGTRVPFLFSGPQIPAGVKSDVMINGLDIYPTVLSLAGVQAPAETTLDGENLKPLLMGDPTDSSLVKQADGSPRTEMFWHFPHPTQCTATMRDQQYKAILNFGAEYIPSLVPLELYQLYGENGERLDLEEAQPIKDPALIQKYQEKIQGYLDHYTATRPHYNPESKALPAELRKSVPTVESHTIEEGTVSLTYKNHGAKLEKAYLLYLIPHPGDKPEWLRTPATINPESKTVTAALPPEAIGAEMNLIDENGFLVRRSVLKKRKGE